MKLTENELELIQEVADSNSIELEVYEGYSGRYMYGSTTTGLVLNNDNDFRELSVEVASSDKDLGRKLAKVESDNLAFQYIYY